MDRLVLDELPCVIILLVLHGMVPLSTKVAGSILERTREKDYAARTSNRVRIFSQDSEYEDTPNGSSDDRASVISHEPKSSGLLSGWRLGTKSPSKGQAVPSIAIPSPVLAAGQPGLFDRLKAGLLLPSPRMRPDNTAGNTSTSFLRASFDLNDTYNSDPELPCTRSARADP